MMVDIVFPAASRPEFTAVSIQSLAMNTDWSLVRRFILYTDGSEPYQSYGPLNAAMLACGEYVTEKLGGPVAIMKHWLGRNGAEVMAKIDNDVVVPPGWLNAAVAVMTENPELSILGLEPPLSRTPSPWSVTKAHPRRAPEIDGPKVLRAGKGYAPCGSIGGVGLMRRSAFDGREGMRPHSIYGGFTEWQIHQTKLVKGWIVPPIDLFLLDRLPFEPWLSLSRKYIAQGDQRGWTNYRPADHRLWDWFFCGECGGTGKLVNSGPYSNCDDCNGTGVAATV